eukprot:CAMPEP_0196579986 /NCGR_PEP_ID=MMETSP1081-20130531/26111_1 /TAXON_ID=36882 /ORGANISM="Pyramimonas amylifera, Strain CCMP720" /LENGTH=353 /DNA_ID=CAMNT_0041899727 /DNA_START=275 /DNA_END=1336 /DNA_ORIENTATION=-
MQYAPFDTPRAVANFLSRWRPQVGVFLESELWPNLMMASHARGIPLALVNACISPKSTQRWSSPLLRPIVNSLLTKFSLICPQSESASVRLQQLGALPAQITPPANLKYSAALFSASQPPNTGASQEEVRERRWVAGSTHPGEEEAVLNTHLDVCKHRPDLTTVIVPRHPERAGSICALARSMGLECAEVSGGTPLGSHAAASQEALEASVLVVNTIGDLAAIYSQCAVAFVGGSLLPSGRGHNVAEAAVASCAVICGRNMGPYTEMVADMLQRGPLSVWQVSDQAELTEAVETLLRDPVQLRARQEAAQECVQSVLDEPLERVWQALKSRVLDKAMFRDKEVELDSHKQKHS